jgi:type VI secretion system secreted protein VgrG
MAQQVKVKIDIEGKNISHYTGVKIWQDIYKHHRFEIAVPFELLEDGQEKFFKDSHKVCGKKITISFEPYYKITRSANNEEFNFIFKGIITSISLRTQGDLSNCFVIGGYSPTILMEDTVERKVFHKMSIGDVVNNVMQGYASNVLKKKVSPQSRSVLPYIVQYNETNYEFVRRLANEYGEWFYYDGSEFVFGKGSKPEVKFSIDGVQSFDMSIMLQPAKFNLKSYIYADDKCCESNSDGAKVDGLNQFGEFALKESEKLFTTVAQPKTEKVVFAANELDNLAKVRKAMRASNMVIFKGSGEVPNISIGTVIDVSGTVPALGGRSSNVQDFGKYMVTEIEHTVDIDGNYSNSFTAVPDSVPSPPPNPEVKHPVGYPELATVIDNQDPDKLGRVKVRFFWPGADKQITSDWIRVNSFYSGGGDGLGMLFIPEVDAQVMVGYEQNNPECPFVMTSLYPQTSKVRTAATKNEEKFFQTYAGNQISLNDKEGKNKIEITNINKTDTALTIEFEADGVITLKTNGKVMINAQDSVSINARQKLSMEAMDIEIKAKNSLKCEAKASTEIKTAQLKINADATAELKAGALVKVEGAMAELKASGIATITGAMVKIN